MNIATNHKEKHEYSLQKIRSHINKTIGEITTIYYWSNTHHQIKYISLKGETGKLSITLHLNNTLHIPDDRTFRHERRWNISLPSEYDDCFFIYKIIFEPTVKRYLRPIKTFIGISPKNERDAHRAYKKKVKKLMSSLTRDIRDGDLAYHGAALHFSLSTGHDFDASLRYFRRIYTRI
ncbi:hypothetical protein ACLEC2_16275 [Lonsdalea quercina]|uniref:hypothetical protein n=1 Tax=Lonsdalea quercina TaxID=71657 RepID=UPI003975946A